MLEINNFPLFIGISILLNVIPGPDTIYIVTRSITQGRIAGLLSSWGICTGAFIHTLAAALGLSAILTTSAYAFTIVKYVSAIYLIGLGVKNFLDKRNPFEIAQTNEVAKTNKTGQAKMTQSSRWAIFGQGVLVDILNPKVAIFFLAFLPQFINPASKAKVVTFIFLGSIVILISLIWEFMLVMFSVSMTGHLRQNVSLGKQLNRLTGIILIGLGIKMLTERMH